MSEREQPAPSQDLDVDAVEADDPTVDVDAVEGDGNDAGSDQERHDREVDDELDRLDDGGGALSAPSASGARSEALPFVLTAREHFASVDDVEVTGDARVDAATARLEEIPDLPTSEHVAVYDDVHRRLQDALSDAEAR